MAFKNRKRFKRSTRKRRSFKRRKRTTRPKLVRKVARNSKAIKVVKDIVDTTTATHTLRGLVTAKQNSGYGVQKWFTVIHNSLTDLKNGLVNLEYHDINDPGNLVVANGNVGSNMREFHFVKTHSMLTLQNMGFTPCNIRIWKCYPKEDTDQDPIDALDKGLQNQVTGYTALTQENLLVHPQDSEVFNQLWRTEEYQKIKLNPGQSKEFNEYTSPFVYDPSQTDTHNLENQSKYGTMQWLISLTGDVNTDSTATYISAASTADLLVSRWSQGTIRYDAGSAFDRFEYVSPTSVTGAFAYVPVRPEVQHIAANGDPRP